MKYKVLILVVVVVLSCKDEASKDMRLDQDNSVTLQEQNSESIPGIQVSDKLDKGLMLEIKQEKLVNREDDREELDFLIIDQRYLKDEDLFYIDFHYPLLNEELKNTYVNFNEFITDYYVNITGTEAGILEDKELICDTIRTNRYREKRFIDYKIYNVNEELVSILFYKKNYYSGTLHPTYSFDCINFDLDRGEFLEYEDFFIEGSEEELREILNLIVEKNIQEGEMYYDCWQISEDDFHLYKDNFVLNDTYVEFYFDDCVMCPSYTGSYSVEIPLTDLLPVLKKPGIDLRELQ